MNWFKKILSHYSEKEQLGEGRGGPEQFDERKLEDWGGEHREEIAIMTRMIQEQDWVNFEEYKQKLMDHYNAPYNKSIVDGIVSAAIGQSTKAINKAVPKPRL